MVAAMDPASCSGPVIDDEHARFVTGAVSISVGSRDAANVPNLTRAVGCRLSADRSRLHVLVSREQSATVLADVAGNGEIAVVFSQPSTHRTVQYKSRNAVVEAAETADHALVTRYRDAFVGELVPLGYSERAARTVVDCRLDDIVAIGFTPEHAFNQTPGPQAGLPLARGLP